MDQGRHAHAATAAAMYSSVDSLRQHPHAVLQHNPLQHSSGARGASADITTAADGRDQELGLDLPITYMPFKFENRRVRIDWRLLHGVDIDKLVRDTDLDTLEQLVTCVTWGDIEAEDTRQLSEGNFVKVFRLAQLLLEYLLYVQENLKYTNGVLDKSRSAAVLHAQGLSTRCRDLYNQLKHCKRELKRTHKTIKTFELMAAAVGGAAQAQAAAAAQAVATQAAATPTKQDAAVQQQQQPVQQQGSVMTAGEMLLQSQLSELTERLTLAVCEAERLRTEQQELQYQIRHLHDTLAAKLNGSSSSRHASSSGGGKAARDSAAEAATAAAVAAAQQEQQQLFMAELQCAQAQIDELQSQNKQLRSQLQQQSDAAAEAAAAAVASPAVEELQAQLAKQAEELARLQSELREREASISVFETTNTTLKQQLEALQRQLASPEATTPSFVAKQRQQLAAAATAQAGLQSDNMKLRQEVLELRLALKAMGAGKRASRDGGRAASGAAAAGEEEDALEEAERLLSDGGGEGGAEGSDWKVQEIERLQEENRQLQAKVVSLQEALHDLEAGNMRLEKRLAAAQAAGFASPSPQASPNAAAAIAEAAGLTGVLGGAGWASVSSSGPAAELTAADLPTAGPVRLAAAGGAAAAAPGSETAVDALHLEQSGDSITPAAQQADADAVAVAAASPKADAAAGDAGGKALIPGGGSSGGGGQEGGSDGGVRIAAYRPSRDGSAGGDAALQSKQQQQQEDEQQGLGRGSANASSNGGNVGGASTGSAGSAGGVARGSINQAAAQQLRALVAGLQAELTPEQLAGEYAEVCSDWDKPFDLTDDEKAQFRQHVPHEVAGLKDVLCAQPHSAEEVSAAKPGMLSAMNRILDAQVASYGIHPGRTGLSNLELLAAMKMLSERREAFEAGLTPEQRGEVEVARLGLLLHPYHALQAVMAELPDGPDGKKHLPAVVPALASAVRPPASSLPAPPPPIRLQPRGPSPGSPAGLGLGGAAAAASGAVTLYAGGSTGATPSPSTSARYGVSSGNNNSAAHDTDSEGPEGQHSPVKRQELYSTLTYHAGAASGGPLGVAVRAGGSSGGGAHLRPPSPLGNEAAREATASGSFSPMSAALQAKQQLLGSPGGSAAAASLRSVSPPAVGSPSAYAAVSSAAAAAAPAGQSSPVKQQQQPVSAAVALATKQYLGTTSFEDSDEF